MSSELKALFANQEEMNNFEMFFQNSKAKEIIKEIMNGKNSFGVMPMTMNFSEFNLNFINKKEEPSYASKEEMMEAEEYDDLSEEDFNLLNLPYTLSNFKVVTRVRNLNVALYAMYAWIATKSSIRYNGLPVFFYENMLVELIKRVDYEKDPQNEYKKHIIEENGISFLPNPSDINNYKDMNFFMKRQLKKEFDEHEKQRCLFEKLNSFYDDFLLSK